MCATCVTHLLLNYSCPMNILRWISSRSGRRKLKINTFLCQDPFFRMQQATKQSLSAVFSWDVHHTEKFGVSIENSSDFLLSSFRWRRKPSQNFTRMIFRFTSPTHYSREQNKIIVHFYTNECNNTPYVTNQYTRMHRFAHLLRITLYESYLMELYVKY